MMRYKLCHIFHEKVLLYLRNLLLCIWVEHLLGGLVKRSRQERACAGCEGVDQEVGGEALLAAAQLGAQGEGGAVVAAGQIKPRHHGRHARRALQAQAQLRPRRGTWQFRQHGARQEAEQRAEQLHQRARGQGDLCGAVFCQWHMCL